MINQHPITPPLELVQKWIDAPDWLGLGCHPGRSVPDETYAKRLVEAAQWGADQELDACCEWLQDPCCADMPSLASDLRYSRRRSKPPSLAEEALQALDEADTGLTEMEWPQRSDQIRRALERLQQLENNQ